MTGSWQDWREVVVGTPLTLEFPYELVAAAWLVALALEARDATVEFDRVRKVELPPHGDEFVDASDGLPGIPEALQLARDATTPAQLYRAVLALLRLADKLAEQEGAIADLNDLRVVQVDLTPPRQVYVWLKPRSALAALSGSLWHKTPKVNRYVATIAQSMRFISLCEVTTASVDVVPVVVPPALLRGHVVSSSYVIALCPLGATSTRFVARVEDQTGVFHARREAPVADHIALANELRQLGTRLIEHGVRIAVLPELTCPPSITHGVIEEWFAHDSPLMLVVAGSFHVWSEGGARPWNQATVIHAGGVGWTHEKRGAFRVLREKAKALGPDAFFIPQDAECEEFREDIMLGSSLRVIDTDLGRIALVVCADVLDTSGPLRADVLERARPDLCIVTSMSDKTSGFLEFASEAFKRGIHVLYANARCLTPPDEILAFGRLAFPDFDDLSASAVWKNGTVGLVGLHGTSRNHAAGDGWLLSEDAFLSVDLSKWQSRRT